MTTIRLLLIALLVSFTAFSNARVLDVELRVFSQPTLLAGNGRFKQAAEQYHRLSLQILASESKLGTEKMWQYAGLAEALATVCANLDNDPKAYEYWANSVRYLLTGGTEWSQMQQYLHQKNEQANTQLLTQMQTFDVAGGYDQSWENDAAVLQVWQEKLNLFAFSGPKIGLKSSRAPASVPVSATPPPVASQVVPGQKKLKGIESNFSQSQGFVPTPTSQSTEVPDSTDNVDSRPAPARAPVTNRHLIQTSPAPIEENATIIASPISEFDYEAAERDEINALANEADLGDLDRSNTERHVPRANIGAESSSGVEAVQRRSFAPVPVEQSNQ